MNLEHLKVGDKIYSNKPFSDDVFIYTIIRQTEKFHIIKQRDNEYKIYKKTGYQYGSQGTGRYGNFDRINFYEVTEEVIKQKNVQIVKSKLYDLHNKINVNQSNYKEINDALEIIYKYK